MSNKGGRPRKYDSPEQMQAAIDEYFAGLTEDNGTWKGVPTIAGLCYELGFEDRHALQEYEKYDGFSATVKKARLRIEEFLEWQLIVAGKPTGAIFNLKNNFGWKDSQEQVHTGGVTINIVRHGDS